MADRGLILSGVSGAGKSTLAKKLCEGNAAFRQVRAVTTRAKRPDDGEATYYYLSDAEFDDLERGNELLSRTEYRGKRYGIRHRDVQTLLGAGYIPLIAATPESVQRFPRASRGDNPATKSAYVAFFRVFLDAPDVLLDLRLLERDGRSPDDQVIRQRQEDRSFKVQCDVILENEDLGESIRAILSAWERFAGSETVG